EYDAAVYGVAKVPVSQNLELFGRVGYGTTSLKADIAGVSATEDGESLNYGAGANWFFDSQNGVRADWTRRDFQDDGAGEVDTWSVGYVRRFETGTIRARHPRHRGPIHGRHRRQA